MPSPVGHALGGIAAGAWAAPGSRRAAAWLAALGAAADLDLLVGAHRGPSHSLGAALLAGILVAAVTRSPRWGAAAALAWGSHVLLDWLGQDNWPPLGIEALWPLSSAYFRAAHPIFPAVSREYWLGAEFLARNTRALVVELAILAPIAALAWRVTRSVRRRR
jgi:hypothetical protein